MRLATKPVTETDAAEIDSDFASTTISAPLSEKTDAPPKRGVVTPLLKLVREHVEPKWNFQPVSMSRTISPSERGYWRFAIPVAADALIDPLRGAISTAELNKWRVGHIRRDGDGSWHMKPLTRWEAMPADQARRFEQFRKGRCLWKKSEFMQFFRDRLTKNIEHGSMGDVTADLEHVRNATGDDGQWASDRLVAHPEAIALLVRVHTWAELLHLVYLSLILDSSKNIAWCPAEYCIGEESVLVMSGIGFEGGDLGLWSQIDSKGNATSPSAEVRFGMAKR